MTAAPWHSGLACHILSISFQADGTVDLHLPPGNCTDMSGAIALAKSITRKMPGFDLWRVRTFCDGRPDTSYEHSQHGERWVAYALHRAPKDGAS